MRIGVAGAGRIGVMHARIIRDCDDVSSVVVTDPVPGRAAQVAAELGVEAVESLDKLLASGLDGLLIASATATHAEVLTAGVAAGLPVFCEKPLAEDLAAATALARWIEDHGGVVQVGFQRRFDPGYVAAHRAVQAGELGWISLVRAMTLDAAPPPAAYIAHSGGLFRDCSVHDADILRWVTGREAVEVYATGANRGEPFFSEYGDVDTATALVTLDDDSLAVLAAGRYNGAGHDVRMEVHGSAGSVAVGLDERTPIRSVEPGVAWPAGPPYVQFIDRFREAYQAELAAFVDLVAGRRSSPCTAADAVAAARIVEACERSRQEHRPVTIEEVDL